MDSIAKFATVALLGCLLILAMPVLGVLFGMLTGWAVGIFFEDMIIGFLARLGMETADLPLWQVGGAMGFLGGFLKTSIHKKAD